MNLSEFRRAAQDRHRRLHGTWERASWEDCPHQECGAARGEYLERFVDQRSWMEAFA
jgi:hypothetical protein